MLKIAIQYLVLMSVVFGGVVSASAQQLWVEYFRKNLFLGIAYHRIGCLTNGNTIISDQEYDGFSSINYCVSGQRDAVGASFFDSNRTSGAAQLDACGELANERYGTPDYAERSDTCDYNILRDCNSDCWIRTFSSCQGKRVPTLSPCT